MTVGKLNELLSNITLDVTFEKSTRIPNAKETGDPLHGTSMTYTWQEIRDTGVDFHITLGEPAFVDRAVLRTGSENASFGKHLSLTVV